MIIYVLVILMVILLIFLITFQIETKIIFNNKIKRSFVIVRIFGLKFIRFNISFKENSNGTFSLSFNKTDSPFKTKAPLGKIYKIIKQSKGRIKHLIKPMLYLWGKIKFYNISVISKIGTSDAASTAILTGCAEGLLCIILNHLKNKKGLKKYKIKTHPEFGQNCFELDLDCIITLKLAHIIITGLKVIRESIKGGDKYGSASN